MRYFRILVTLDLRDISALSPKTRLLLAGVPLGDAVRVFETFCFASTELQARNVASRIISDLFPKGDIKFFDYSIMEEDNAYHSAIRDQV